jgi:hypothetical protein
MDIQPGYALINWFPIGAGAQTASVGDDLKLSILERTHELSPLVAYLGRQVIFDKEGVLGDIATDEGSYEVVLESAVVAVF